MYRFVVCVDVEAKNLPDAYAGLLQRMNANDWESTDEAYDPDGEEIDEDELAKARDVVLAIPHV
jgi:hypothetical protein